jgi:class 3 adenylate cyclase/ATP/maltotriose-dependent transcriptional regulator MalT
MERGSAVENAIVGREAELVAVERFLDGVPTGPAALVIEGEAGIGKTTVWLAALRAAESRALRVLRARPAESEAKLSYAALADLVGMAFDETRAMLPPVQERAVAAALLRAEADEAAHARTTATALVTILTALAEQEPVLLAVDDVQWLDPASEEALAFAVRRLPEQLGLLLARRSGPSEDLPLGLARALPEERLERIVPGPLSLAALHHLIKSRLGSSLPRPMLARLAEASGGNPFFALEIARALARRAGDHATGEPLPVPRSLEELVAARVSGLSGAARQVALAAAALSHPTAATLARALPAEDDIRTALLEAEEAGVLVAERERIRFAHPLLASVIYGSASAERRRQLHARLAAVVVDTEERGRHLALSATEPDETTAAELEQAARQAAKRGAHQAAAELYEASRRLTPGGRAVEVARRTLGEASALLAAGDVAGARSLAERAAATSIPSLHAEALFLLGDITWISGEQRKAVEFLEQALAETQGDRELAARIYAKLVNFTVNHDPARAIEHSDAAMKLLSPERDSAALAYVLFDRLWAGIRLGRGEEEGLFERWRELEAKAGPEAPKSPIPLIYFWSIDDFEAARERHAIEDRWYRERGEEVWRAERLAHLAVAELRAGRWDLAEQYVEEGCSAVAQVERPGPWTSPFRIRALVDAHRGRTERARATLLPLIEDAERDGQAFWEALFLSSLGFVEFAHGNHRAADEALTRMRDRLDAIGTRDLPPEWSEPFHIESLLALGELQRARDVLERLEERGRVFPRLWIDVTLPRARALVLAAGGDLEAALAALDELDLEAAARLPFDLAWTLLVRGRLHRRAKQKRAAADALRRSLEIFERLGAPAWVDQSRAELDRVGLRRSREELTATELRVAELAAAGLTNREVASRAFMSPKTVEANLARIYRKLGIRSRAELGARIEGRRSQAAPDRQARAPRRASGRELATILFTDLVGSTEKARALGDAAWATLVASHNDSVRRELARFSGEEIDTAGDGFLALFDGPAQAIRCALAIRAELHGLGLEVRAGVHTGELERRTGDKPRGIAIHVGARIMSLAGAGEVLVSSTTRDLVAGSGLEFEDRGEHELRGIEGARRVFAPL